MAEERYVSSRVWEDFISSESWSIVVDVLGERISQVRDAFEESESWEAVLYNQGEVKSMRFVLSLPRLLLEQALEKEEGNG